MLRTPAARLTAMNGTAVRITARMGPEEDRPNHSEARNAHTTAGSASSTSTVSLNSPRAKREAPIPSPSSAPAGMPTARPMP